MLLQYAQQEANLYYSVSITRLLSCLLQIQQVLKYLHSCLEDCSDIVEDFVLLIQLVKNERI